MDARLPRTARVGTQANLEMDPRGNVMAMKRPGDIGDGSGRPPAKRKRTVLYLRVSKNEDGTSGSVADQERECRAFCAEKGYEVVDVYIDDGISGKTTRRRPGLQRLFKDAAQKHFELVVVFMLDRAGRTIFSMSDVAKRLDDASVRLESVKEGPCDEVQLALRALFSTIFMKNHRDHLMKGMIGLALKGHNLGRPPVGLRIVKGAPGKVEPDPAYAHLPALANELLLDRRLNGQQIATELNRLGHKMPSGAAFTRLHVTGSKLAHGLLTNPAYTGRPNWNRTGRTDSETHGSTTYLKDKGEIVPGVRDVCLVPPERFEAAQARLAELNTGQFTHAPGRRRLLSGLTYCEQCGGKMMIRAADTKGRPRIRCDLNYTKARREDGHLCCENGRTYYVDEVETLVLDAVGAHLAEPGFLNAFVDAYNAARAPLIAAYGAENARLARERTDAERAVQNLVRSVARGTLTDEEAAAELADARERVKQAISRQRLLEASPVELQIRPANLKRFLDAIAALKLLPPKTLAEPESRDLLDTFRSLIDRIVVRGNPAGWGFALEIHGLIAALVADPASSATVLLMSKNYKKTQLQGTQTSQILTILDLKFIIDASRDRTAVRTCPI